MKFAENVLLEIIAIVQKGLSEGVDISEELRQVDVEMTKAESRSSVPKVELSARYLASKGRVF